MPLILLVILLLFDTLAAYAIPSFPTAEGYGANSIGGRVGSVYKVTTTTDNNNPGSLRYCITRTGPRTCVFTTGGTITLTSRLDIENPYITIAGETAPGGGIQLRDNSLLVITHDVIIRHLRLRPGENVPDPADTDAIIVTTSGAYNIMLDHLSMSWAIDETAGLWDGPHDVTYQWSIVSEPLPCPTPIPPGCGGHKGFLVGASNSPYNWTVHHTLLAHNDDRNPLIEVGSGTAWINNVIYNWGGEIMNIWPVYGQIHINVIGNYFKQGPNSQNKKPIARWKDSNDNSTYSPNSELYHSDNYDTVFGTDVVRDSGTGTGTRIVVIGSPLSHPTVTTQAVVSAYSLVLANAGATKPARDSVDTRVVGHVQNGNGAIINTVSSVGGYPTLSAGTAPTDTDNDGMSDAWETLCSGTLGTLNPNSADGQTALSGIDTKVNGYTALEVYLHEMAGDREINTCGEQLLTSLLPPNTLSTSASTTVTAPSVPTSLSTSASSSISGPSAPTSLSTSASSSITFPSSPSGISTP